MSKHAPPYPNAATDPFNQVPGMNRPTKTMTAETDLLPLPEWCLDDDRAMYVLEGMSGPQYRNDMHDYARACVSSATEAARANLAELQREVEGLRAEVALLRTGAENERLHQSVLLGRARERAERLAGALREMIELRESTQRGEVHPTRHELDIVRDARAALDQKDN